MYLIDSANVSTIKKFCETYGIKGVTTNPTLMAKENRTDFFHHLREITHIVHPYTLYVQVNGESTEEMIEETELYLNHINPPFSVKIPATSAGFKAMKALKDRVPITATGIVDFHQGMMAIESGATALAVYVSRMLSSGLAPYELIDSLRLVSEREERSALIIAASFKSTDQIKMALEFGAHEVTVTPKLLETMFLHPLTEQSVKEFSKSFKERYNTPQIKSGN
jgi:fructose-6-phosphate aldolase 2